MVSDVECPCLFDCLRPLVNNSGVAPGLSRGRRLTAVTGVLALTICRRWSHLLKAGKEDQVVIRALRLINYIDDMLILYVVRDGAEEWGEWCSAETDSG